jgi:flavodoxin
MKNIDESGNTKFLDLHMDNYLNWKNCYDKFVPKKLFCLFSLYDEKWDNFLT